MVESFFAIAIAWFFAQVVLKPIIASFRERRLIFEAVWWQGGMPSGHASLVGALCSVIIKTQGFDSILFSIVVVFSVLVLYEALVTRNILMRQADAVEKVTNQKLERVVGHQWGEVLVGLVVGAIIAWYLV